MMKLLSYAFFAIGFFPTAIGLQSIPLQIPSNALKSPLIGRSVDTTPWPHFFATIAALPVWATTVLPLSVACTVANQIIKPLRQKPHDGKPQLLDSGFVPTFITPAKDRPYDIVVLGGKLFRSLQFSMHASSFMSHFWSSFACTATGFAGYLATLHLAQTYGVGKTVRWAIAGRSQAKIDAIKKRLESVTSDASQIDTILVDTTNPETLPRLVDVTRVVVSTAGPFASYGNTVVEFCAKYGTHYADITGEVDWVESMISQWQSTAQRTGAVLVSFCGHDSIPWDLSTLYLQRVLEDEFDDEIESVRFLDEVKGNPSGGTIATVVQSITSTQGPADNNEHNPMQLLPDGNPSNYHLESTIEFAVRKVESTEWGPVWTAPFVMATVNARVAAWSYAVRSSKGSQQERKRRATYDEALLLPDFKTAFCSLASFVMFASALLNPITRYLLQQYVLPKPGEGPSFEDMEKKSKCQPCFDTQCISNLSLVRFSVH